MRRPIGRARGLSQGLPLRAILPNAVTALALCSGLTGIRFAVLGDWEKAVAMVLLAAILDGLDGRIARFVRGESRFGAELDSLSDAIAFGVSPALILYLWSLVSLPRLGWVAALSLAVCCALRLARFNARIDVADQPHKMAGFLTGVPAPAGAGLAFLPMYLWIWSGEEVFRDPRLVAPWVALVAVAMVSSIATFSAGSLRVRRSVRFEALVVIVLLGVAVVSLPWETLTVLAGVYALSLPFSIAAYRRVKRRARLAQPPSPDA